jgi:pimeloyl-ACP methyl ester carboxylesterase
MTDGLLLIHAFPLDHRMWEPQVQAMQRIGVTVVAPDLPGFGRTPPSAPVLTMDLAAQHCLRALDEAGLDRALVCGASMGGYVALELWRSAPDRVTGLLLANTRAEADTQEAAGARRALASRLRREGSAFLLADPPKLVTSPRSAEILIIMSEQSSEAIAAASLGMAERPDARPSLPGISVPTLVVTSAGDQIIAPAVSTGMALSIPDAELLELPGDGHLSNLEAPEAFNTGLVALAERCGLRRPRPSVD